ncbi:MAG: DNA mismatch repair protein MutS [Bacteroidales bacterium]|nr:DNA mismatch repair protein MutS [Bacteroidales bacterium]
MATKKFTDTPLMRQYLSIKAKHPDAMLLFRVGDFYETYLDDAPKAAKILGITLTQRSGTNPELGALAGFPHHALDTYLPKLVRAGLRVAVCDQLEDPKTAKGIVKRGITELVTPGVAMTDGVLVTGENNFLCCVNFTTSNVGIAFLDISTGEFMMGQGDIHYADRLLATFRPKEILFEKGKRQTFVEAFGTKWTTYPFDDWAFQPQSANERLLKHFDTQNLKGFGIDGQTAGVTAAGAILYYLDVTQHDGQAHISRLQRIDEQSYVWLDRFSIRNLEIFNDGRDGTSSLADIEDRSTTPMGSRLLKRWLVMPLRDVNAIRRRHEGVGEFVSDALLTDAVTGLLKMVGDMERLVGKIACLRITPREVVMLKRALEAIPELKKCIGEAVPGGELARMVGDLDDCDALRRRIEHDIVPDPPTTIQKCGVIAEGVSAELDELRQISASSRDYLADLQERLAAETSIPSLKVAYNNVFGYFIEVRNTHKDKVPAEWIRKQTMTSAERYVTPELKVYEEKILGADQRIAAIEAEIYSQLLSELNAHLGVVQGNAARLAEVDVLHTFARNAVEFGYCRPEMTDDDILDIKEGRHPVIERLMSDGDTYVSNDLLLDKEGRQIIIVTGPNMAGKSALLRQTALIVLLAQCGSYVPASAARIGIVDKIFTRVGASDNLSQGESTFMVEMTEAANILNNVTPRSLVLFDELGRGTSTYDGISLAWAIVEYLHNNERAKAKTLFATHYHELNDMEKMYDGIRNYNVSVREAGGKVIFLRKLVEGGSEHSFGIHVAKLAGMPKSVVDRAGEILTKLEQDRDGGSGADGASDRKGFKRVEQKEEGAVQLSLFQLDDPLVMSIRDEITGLDIDNLTPREALNKLYDIRRLLGLGD